VFLLHGWTATADLNFFTCYSALGQHFRVIAIDHRGHGRGIRTSRPFRLSDCADDVAAVADQLGIDSFIPVGYSMGGTIAQLMWKRHRARVRGLVLCATSGYFASHTIEKRRFALLTTIMHASRVTPKPVRDWVSDRLFISRKTRVWEKWAVDEVASHEWRHVLEAGAALGRYDSRGWLGDVDVPVGVVVNDHDRVVRTKRQYELAAAIPGARVWEVDGDHDSVWANAAGFVPAIVGACLDVSHRSAGISNDTPLFEQG
jgi:3-oxoadipate enol-lactonase